MLALVGGVLGSLVGVSCLLVGCVITGWIVTVHKWKYKTESKLQSRICHSQKETGSDTQKHWCFHLETLMNQIKFQAPPNRAQKTY